MSLKSRFPALVVLALLATLAPATKAVASSSDLSAAGRAALSNCRSHPGGMTRAFSLAALRNASRNMSSSSRKSSCPQALRSEIGGLIGKTGRHSTSAVLKDCADNAGLSHRYTVRNLRRALHTMPRDYRRYTNCGAAVRSQLTVVS